MYFTIKNGHTMFDTFIPNDRGIIEKIISNFPEVEKMNDDRFKAQYMDYYGLDIKKFRKIKILSLTDDVAKERLTILQTLLYDKNLITLSDEKPKFIIEGGSIGTSGMSIEDREKKRISSDKLIEKLKKEFEECINL